MTKKRFLALQLILLTLFAWGIDFDPGGYGAISDIYSTDDNAGLTAFPVLSVPMGGRAEGMAGAYTAVANDLSYIEWNPAGSSMLNYTELGFFHNNWIADTRLEGVVWSSRYKDLGFGAAGKWLYTPFSEYNMYGERVSKGYYSEAVATINASYNFFNGYYFSGVSVGANLKGAFRFVPDYSDADDQGNNKGALIAGSGLSQSAVMVMADVGALTRFDLFKFYTSRERNTSAALVFKNLGPSAGGDPLPSAMTAALAYKPWRPLTIALDFTLPMNFSDFSLSEKPYWALGFDVNITTFLSMRTGILFKTGGSRISMGSALDLGKISLDLNYTLDLLTQFTPLNRISLAVRFNFGDQGRKVMSERVDTLYLDGLDAYAAGDYVKARSNWEEVLKINPDFDPAREGIALLDASQALDQRMLDMQNLDF